MCAARELCRDRLDNRRMVVAEQQRAVASHVVDVLVSVDIPFARPCGARHEQRMRLEVATDVGNAVGEQPHGAGMQPGRARRLVMIATQDRRF